MCIIMFYSSILSKILGNNFGKSRRENLSKTLLKAQDLPLLWNPQNNPHLSQLQGI